MNAFAGEISEFLHSIGVNCVAGSCGGMTVLHAGDRCIVPWPVTETSPYGAQEQALRFREVLDELEGGSVTPIVVTEDRWRSRGMMMKARVKAHLEIFTPIYARNCQVRKIDKETASSFLEENHSYGDASCRYRYGLYLKRHTGRTLLNENLIEPGSLVAVATFSNARKWQKGDKTIRSYEWTRYASLPGVRVSGGMSKMLGVFIEDVSPDDIMSYADLEWSEGSVYERLGFTLEGQKAPVLFSVDDMWRRIPVRLEGECPEAGSVLFQNLGSNKYRLKLTDYE